MSRFTTRLQKASKISISLPSVTAINHGEQLRGPSESGTNVGIAPLLGSSWQSQLSSKPVPTEGFYRVSAKSRGQWPAAGFSNGSYVYNNDPTNIGGWVPAGGMMIDGYFVPEGTYVLQFIDIQGGFYFSDADYSFMLRGCRHRPTVASTAPGLLNVNGSQYLGNQIMAHFCDVGGVSLSDSNIFEVSFKISGSVTNKTSVRMLRNYFSYQTTTIQFPDTNVPSFELIENYSEKPVFYYGTAGPNNDGNGKHLNGVWICGGQTNCLIARNKILMQNPDPVGRTVNQTDCIIWFQAGGTNVGTSTLNSDGSSGYTIKDNYLGGGGWTIYAGKPDAKAAETAQNFHYTGNKITTQWWPNGGYFGACADQPVWGSYGNTKANNTWADGPNAGNTFI